MEGGRVSVPSVVGVSVSPWAVPLSGTNKVKGVEGGFLPGQWGYKQC